MDTFYETQPQLWVGKSAHLPTGHAQEPVLKMPCEYSYILTCNRTSKKIRSDFPYQQDTQYLWHSLLNCYNNLLKDAKAMVISEEPACFDLRLEIEIEHLKHMKVVPSS